jgi:hypothetical protein
VHGAPTPPARTPVPLVRAVTAPVVASTAAARLRGWCRYRFAPEGSTEVNVPPTPPARTELLALGSPGGDGGGGIHRRGTERAGWCR